jgi:hypothetical protein
MPRHINTHRGKGGGRERERGRKEGRERETGWGERKRGCCGRGPVLSITVCFAVFQVLVSHMPFPPSPLPSFVDLKYLQTLSNASLSAKLCPVRKYYTKE